MSNFLAANVQETGRVVEHIEMWDVEPGKVLKRLLKPASKTPSSRWETFMLSVHEGDIQGVWLAASAPILKYSAPLVGVSLLTKALTGHGLPVRLCTLVVFCLMFCSYGRFATAQTLILL